MRIANINVPDNKRIVIALTYIFGVGLTTSQEACAACKIDENKKAKELTPEEVNALQDYISENVEIEGDLRRRVNANISRLISISCHRGIRHREGLPVRGQKTRNKGGKRRDRRRKKASAL